MMLVNCFIRQFAITFNTLLSVTFHDAVPSCCFWDFEFVRMSYDNNVCFSITIMLLTCVAR